MTESSGHISLPEAVLRRPEMYTLRGTFEEVVAFLEGYYSGLAKGHPNVTSVQDWDAFRLWLSSQLGAPSSEVFSALLSRCGDGPTALSAMLDLLSRYQSSGRT